MLVLVGGMIIGLFAGVASAVLVETTSGELLTIHQIEEQAGYDILATIPRELPERLLHSGSVSAGIGRSQHLSILREPRAVTGEAYGSLRNAILLSTRP